MFPIKLSFGTTQSVTIEKGLPLEQFHQQPMVIWRDYLIGSYARAQHTTRGLFLWSMSENSIFYFEVCHFLSVSVRLESQFAADGVRPTLYKRC